MLIWPLGTNFSEIVIKIQTFSLKKICLKRLSISSRPQSVHDQIVSIGLNELIDMSENDSIENTVKSLI